MASDPTINGAVVLTEEATSRNGAALDAAAQAQGVFLVAVDSTGHVVDFDPRTLATSTDKITTGATPYYAAPDTIDVDLTSTAGRLMSFSARETTEAAGARAVLLLRDGPGGTVVAIVTLGSGESVRDSYGPNGIALASGLTVDRVSGTSEVTVAIA